MFSRISRFRRKKSQHVSASCDWLQGQDVEMKKSEGKEKKELNYSKATKGSEVDDKTTTHSAGRFEGEEKHAYFRTPISVGMSYPEYQFAGFIEYSHTSDHCNIVCEKLMSSMDLSHDFFIGFETEWPVADKTGKPAKTALVQICLNESQCYLFHISHMAKFPIMLKKLIEHDRIKKVGLNVEYDLWKLEADFDDFQAGRVIQRSTVDLCKLANLKLKSAENWSLEGLAKNQLQLRISKDPAVRKCDWSQFPLPDEQRAYAATDAAVSLMLYQKLISM